MEKRCCKQFSESLPCLRGQQDSCKVQLWNSQNIVYKTSSPSNSPAWYHPSPPFLDVRPTSAQGSSRRFPFPSSPQAPLQTERALPVEGANGFGRASPRSTLAECSVQSRFDRKNCRLFCLIQHIFSLRSMVLKEKPKKLFPRAVMGAGMIRGGMHYRVLLMDKTKHFS